MENQSELLGYVVTTFERLRIPYFVTGSFASIYYGEYRTTVDIDLVADLQLGHIAALMEAFKTPQFYMSEDAALDAVNTRFQFNILHVPTGLKVDVIVLQGNAFDESRVRRIRRIIATGEVQAWFASPEDVILKKLLFYQEGESEKHLRDIAGMLRISGSTIDRKYIQSWAEQLGVANLWEAIVAKEETMP